MLTSDSIFCLTALRLDLGHPPGLHRWHGGHLGLGTAELRHRLAGQSRVVHLRAVATVDDPYIRRDSLTSKKHMVKSM